MRREASWPPGASAFNRSAACSWHLETDVGVEAAHQGVAAAGTDLDHLGGARVQPHEPWHEYLVLGMVIPVGDLGAVRRGALLEGIAAFRETDADDRVTGFHDVAAAVLWRGGGEPRLHGVVDEW